MALSFFALGQSLSFRLADVPWSFVMAFASLALIYVLFRQRADLFADLGFSTKEVALLCLGSIAGWAVNLPVYVVGGTYLAVNVGGTIVPLLLIAWWLRKGKLAILPTLAGTTLVAIVAWRIASFHPSAGIVARYPDFFLPVVVALVFALVVSFRNPLRGVPIAYASGTLGALVGADLFHMGEIAHHFQGAPENTIISIGGAGVFDMVFLAGTFAMALDLAIVVALASKAAPAAPPDDYPTKPISLRDSRRVSEAYRRLEAPDPLQRALAGIALSNLALVERDYPRSLRMSWLAVNALMEAEGVRAHLENGAVEALKGDVARLRDRFAAGREAPPGLRDAGEANDTAKRIVAALAPRSGLGSRLEGVQ